MKLNTTMAISITKIANNMAKSAGLAGLPFPVLFVFEASALAAADDEWSVATLQKFLAVDAIAVGSVSNSGSRISEVSVGNSIDINSTQ